MRDVTHSQKRCTGSGATVARAQGMSAPQLRSFDARSIGTAARVEVGVHFPARRHPALTCSWAERVAFLAPS